MFLVHLSRFFCNLLAYFITERLTHPLIIASEAPLKREEAYFDEYVPFNVYQANTGTLGILLAGDSRCFPFSCMRWWRDNNGFHSGSYLAADTDSHTYLAAQSDSYP